MPKRRFPIKLEEIYICPSYDTLAFAKLMEKLDDPLPVPLCGIVIDYPGSLYQKSDRVSAVSRLRDIHQLGIADRQANHSSACGTRYSHSLLVAAKMDLKAQQLGLNRTEAVLSGMHHDIASTPFSDSVAKALELNDEEYFLSVLNRCPEALELLESEKFSIKTLCKMVNGQDKSPLGQLLSSKGSIDIDRWSYVVADALNVGQAYLVQGDPFGSENQRLVSHEGIPYRHRGIRGMANLFGRILEKIKEVDPFEAARVYKDQVVFEDIGAVTKFLEARVCMFTKEYANGHLRAREAFFGELLGRMREVRVINDSEMFSMSEAELERRCNVYDAESSRKIFDRGTAFSRYGLFDYKTDETALRKFLSRRVETEFLIKSDKPINPALETPIYDSGTVTPYQILRPEHAKHIRRELKKFKALAVYGPEGNQDLEAATQKAKTRFKSYE